MLVRNYKKHLDKELSSLPKFDALKLVLVRYPIFIKMVLFLSRIKRIKKIEGLICEERYIPSKNNGADIRVRIIRPNNNERLPCMVFYHGGGYMIGVPENSLKRIESYINKRPCVIIAPDYRKSIHEPYPAGFNDCYDTLLWAKDNAKSLNINPSQFILAGNSAGGGLAIAVALKARDTKDINVSFQMPLYPMIDHRQITESSQTMTDVPVWNSQINQHAWQLYLKGLQKIPIYASPSLNSDYSVLPPTITYVGTLDPFLDETIQFVEALRAENIPVHFELYEGAYHAFETRKPDTTIAKRAIEFELKHYADYYDKYIVS